MCCCVQCGRDVRRRSRSQAVYARGHSHPAPRHRHQEPVHVRARRVHLWIRRCDLWRSALCECSAESQRLHRPGEAQGQVPALSQVSTQTEHVISCMYRSISNRSTVWQYSEEVMTAAFHVCIEIECDTMHPDSPK